MGQAPFTIAVLGAGSWGTALAMQLARAGNRVILWGRDPGHVAAMSEARANQRYLPGIPFPENITIDGDLRHAVASAEHVLIATPSHAFSETLVTAKATLADGAGVVWASKGFEPGSGRFLHEVAQSQLGDERFIAVATGPSFAREVAMDLPTAITVASNDSDFGTCVARALHWGHFRAYTSDDIVGAELGGAVKNVLAVATGICDGMQLGDNARAALVTRGLAEMMRLGRTLGAQPATLMGLAGMGDLVLTCTGDQSRNRRLGLALGGGKSIQQALDDIGQVVEGVGTAEEVMRLAARHQVEMPISEQVHGILHRNWDPKIGVRRLLGREQKHEQA